MDSLCNQEVHADKHGPQGGCDVTRRSGDGCRMDRLRAQRYLLLQEDPVCAFHFVSINPLF